MSIRGINSSLLRWLGALALVGGLLVVAMRFPTRPADGWSDIQAFALDGDECERFRTARLTTVLTAANDPDAPTTYGEAARAFGLELDLVCQANDLPSDCSTTALPEGTFATLPLYYDLTAAPAAVGTP